MTAISASAACPCGSGRKYKRCCRPVHREDAPAKHPEALMRARYCAYALGLVEFILATTHPDSEQWTRDRATWAGEVARFARDTRFLGLEVRSSSRDGDAGEVCFAARLERGGVDVSFAERSRFARVDGRWLYRSGVILE